ncbi:MAG TPA: hypothetical protein VK211_05635 [Kamptonema sp.]|nr:hypothetical protein [Kamptonema sp.]
MAFQLKEEGRRKKEEGRRRVAIFSSKRKIVKIGVSVSARG